MYRYRRKTVEIEAMRFWNSDPAHVAKCLQFAGGRAKLIKDDDNSMGGTFLLVYPRIGNMVCSDGDWIVKREAGEMVVYNHDHFEALYEAVND